MSGTASKDNARAEEFKRATAGVLRAIAEVPDVQVAGCVNHGKEGSKPFEHNIR